MLVKIRNELVEIVGENPYSTSNEHAKILNNTVLDPMTPSNGQERADTDLCILRNYSRVLQYELIEMSQPTHFAFQKRAKQSKVAGPYSCADVGWVNL